MKKQFVYFIVFVAVISLAGAGYANFPGGGARGGGHGVCPMKAQYGEGYGHQRGGPIFGHFMKKAHFILENKEALGLTEEQVTTIKDLKLNVAKEMINLKAETQINMIDVRSQLKQDKVNLDSVNALVDKSFASMSARIKSVIASYAKLKSILTPEQQAKLKEIKAGKREMKQ